MSFTPGPNNLMAMALSRKLGFRGVLPFLVGLHVSLFTVCTLTFLFIQSLQAVMPHIEIPLKAVGSNKFAAEYGGISVNRSILTALAISGALAGLAGALQVMGMGKRISIFTSQEGFGFAGIVVALIGCSNPFGVLVAGLFYGALMYGGSKLNLEGVPTQLINVIVGTVVFFIAISVIFANLKRLKGRTAVKKVAAEKEGKK